MDYRDGKSLKRSIQRPSKQVLCFYLSNMLLGFPEVTLSVFVATAEPDTTASPPVCCGAVIFPNEGNKYTWK